LEGPEVHTPHTHAGGGGHGGGLPRWLELTLAIAALVTSVSSIAIALHHGETMEKLVQANSIPYLEASPSDATAEGVDQISIDLTNRGVGPAHERSLRIKAGDAYVRNVQDLIVSAVGPADAPAALLALRSYRNTQRERFIPANSSQFLFRVRKTPENAAYWDRLDSAVTNVHMEYCYCSVFEECWAVHDEEHTRVKQCTRDEAHEFNP